MYLSCFYRQCNGQVRKGYVLGFSVQSTPDCNNGTHHVAIVEDSETHRLYTISVESVTLGVKESLEKTP